MEEVIVSVSPETLKKSIIFNYLKGSSRKALLERAQVLRYDEGERVINEGEISPYFFTVLEGCVSVSVTNKENRDIYISTIGEGDVFGEAGIFLKTRRTASIVARDASVLLRLDREDLLDFLKTSPSEGMKILMIVVYSLLKKLREANQELAYERKTDVEQADIDDLVHQFMKDL